MSRKTKPGLKCPHCKKVVGFAEQMAEWDELYGEDINIDDPKLSWAIITVWCKHCNQYAYSVDMAGSFTIEEKVTKGPFKGKILVLPTKKKPKN